MSPGVAAARTIAELASHVVVQGRAAGVTVGVAESLTGGALCSAIVAVPGASAVLRGGVVAYATELKASLLGVDAGLLAARGAVDPDVAAAMALGARRAFGSTFGVATTGVAGPDSQDGKPPGVVFIAVVSPAGVTVESLRLAGDRAQVRAGAVEAALVALAAAMAGVAP